MSGKIKKYKKKILLFSIILGICILSLGMISYFNSHTTVATGNTTDYYGGNKYLGNNVKNMFLNYFDSTYDSGNVNKGNVNTNANKGNVNTNAINYYENNCVGNYDDTDNNYKYLINYYDVNYESKGTFMDTFITLPYLEYYKALKGYDKNKGIYNSNITYSSWNEYIYNQNISLVRLNETAKDAGVTVNIFLTLMNPSKDKRTFISYDYDGDGSNETSVSAVLKKMLEQQLRHWNAKKNTCYSNLNLVGFYWYDEDVYSAGEETAIRTFNTVVHNKDYKTIWNPYVHKTVIEETAYQDSFLNGYSYGFDYVSIQSGYYFNTNWENENHVKAAMCYRGYCNVTDPIIRLKYAKLVAHLKEMGVEFEADNGSFEGEDTDIDYYNRLYDFMEEGSTRTNWTYNGKQQYTTENVDDYTYGAWNKAYSIYYFPDLARYYVGSEDSSTFLLRRQIYDDVYKYSQGEEVTKKVEYDDVNKCTIAYYYNYTNTSGTSPGNIGNSSCTYGNGCTLTSKTYTRTGYTFVNWNTERDGTGQKYGTTDKPAKICKYYTDYTTGGIKKVHLYAQWKANTYTIKFDANGGSGTMSNMSMTYDVSKNLSANSYTRSQYKFVGWNTKSDGSGTTYIDKASVKNLTSTNGGTVTLYAKWEPIQCTVEFYNNNNNATGSISPVVCNYGKKCTLTEINYSITGYKFNKWNTKSDGTGNSYSKETYYICKYANSNNTVKLYAQWKANKVKIKLNANGGTFNQTNTSTKYTINSNNENLVYTNNDGTTTEFIHSISYGKKIANGGYGLINYNSGVSNGFTITREGYHAVDGAEWICLSGDCKKGQTYDQDETYAASDFCDASNDDCEVVLGVNWKKNQVKIKLNTNGGLVTGTNTNYSKDSSDYVLNKYGSRIIHTIDYDGKLSTNLLDWNSPNYLYITKENGNYSAISKKEWICTSGECKGEVYDQTTQYSASAFCNAKKSDCEVTLKVNWQGKLVKVTLDNQNATSAGTKNVYYRYNTTQIINDSENTSEKITCYYYSNANLSSDNCLDNGYTITKPTRTGYIFKGYYTKANGEGTQYVNANGSFINNIYKNVTEEITLYANWEKIACSVEYHYNFNDPSGNSHGTGPKNSVCPFDDKETCILSTNENYYTRTGYTFDNWNTERKGSGTTFEGGTSYSGICKYEGSDKKVHLYAQWKANTYTIKYDANGGTGTMSDSTCNYDKKCTLSKNTYEKKDYYFIGWKDESGNYYLDKSSVNNLTSASGGIVTLYAQWASNEDGVTFDESLNIDNNSIIIENFDYKTKLTNINDLIIINGDNVTKNIFNRSDVLISDMSVNPRTGDKFKIQIPNTAEYILTISVRGDTSGDGKFDVIDIVNIAKHIANTTELPEEFKLAADVDGNDIINVMDIIKIAKYIANGR